MRACAHESMSPQAGISRLQIRSGSFTSPAETDRCSRDCAAVDIQVIGRKAHPPTSLNRGVGCQNEAVCDSSCLPDNLARLQMSVRPWPRKDSRSEHPRHNSGHAPTKRAAEHTCDKPEESRMRPCREPSSGARSHWRDRLRLTLSCLQPSHAFVECGLSWARPCCGHRKL